MNASSFGGIFGLIVTWFAALLGPISVPMILGLLPAFKKSGSVAAISSIIGGLLVFVILKMIPEKPLSLEMAAPILASLIMSLGLAYFRGGVDIWFNYSALSRFLHLFGLIIFGATIYFVILRIFKLDITEFLKKTVH